MNKSVFIFVLASLVTLARGYDSDQMPLMGDKDLQQLSKVDDTLRNCCVRRKVGDKCTNTLCSLSGVALMKVMRNVPDGCLNVCDGSGRVSPYTMSLSCVQHSQPIVRCFGENLQFHRKNALAFGASKRMRMN
uniref:DB domain-containing protein n=1 Tax=Loa loa TaxID=7209 RepID=A0A1I7VAN2_LOALO